MSGDVGRLGGRKDVIDLVVGYILADELRNPLPVLRACTDPELRVGGNSDETQHVVGR